MKTFSLFLFAILVHSIQAQPIIYHTMKKQYIGSVPASYIFSDSVTMRAQPSLSGKFLNYLPINTPCYILEVGGDTLMVNGVKSLWYKIELKDDTSVKGWVWGGFITSQLFGSNENPDVKFLIGFSKSIRKKAEGSIFNESYIKIKVVKDNKILDEVEQVYNESWIEFYTFGKRGIKGIHDVLAIHIPCHGGCGCYTGDLIYFWDGEKIIFVFEAGGSPDGEYSSGNTLYFPSDAEGESGYLIIRSQDPDYDYIENNEQKKGRRIIVDKFMEWNGEKLIESSTKKAKKEYQYFEMKF